MKKLLILLLIFVIACAVPENVPKANQDIDYEDREIDYENLELPDEEVYEVPISKEASSFTFEGYAPGKSHIGSFDKMEGVIIYENGSLIGVRGIIQASSVNTGIGGLDAHLQKDEFFDAAVYPEITFNSVKIEEGTMSGKLTFRGVSEIISFPVEVTENSISADFLLDSTPYGMTYIGVDKQIKIKFLVSN